METLLAQTVARAALTTRAEEEERPALGGMRPDTRTCRPRGEETPASWVTPCSVHVYSHNHNISFVLLCSCPFVSRVACSLLGEVGSYLEAAEEVSPPVGRGGGHFNVFKIVKPEDQKGVRFDIISQSEASIITHLYSGYILSTFLSSRPDLSMTLAATIRSWSMAIGWTA